MGAQVGLCTSLVSLLMLSACTLDNPFFELLPTDTDGPAPPASTDAEPTTGGSDPTVATATTATTTAATIGASTEPDTSSGTPDPNTTADLTTDNDTSTDDGDTLEATGNDATGNDVTGNDVTGNDMTGNDMTGDTTDGEPISPCAPEDPDLIACYDCTEDFMLPGKFIDRSQYKHDGTTFDVQYVPGYDGTALELGLASQVKVPASPTFKVVDAYTVAAWVRITAQPQPGKRFSVVDRHGAFAISIVANHGAACPVYMQAEITAGVPFPLAKWTHIACIYNGNRIDLVVDGTIVNSQMFPVAALADFNVPTFIGSKGENSTNMLLGRIDDLMIWNTAIDIEKLCDATGACA